MRRTWTLRNESQSSTENEEASKTVWQWQGDEGQWEPYSPSDCSLLDAAVSSGQTSVALTLSSGTSYCMDLKKMVQVNLVTSYKRKIRCQTVKPESSNETSTLTAYNEGTVQVKEEEEEEEEPEEQPAAKRRREESKSQTTTKETPKEEIKTEEAVDTVLMNGKAPVDSECKAKLGKNLQHKVKLLQDFYTKMEDGSFKCMSCLPKVTKIIISQHSLFNLKRHIQRVHGAKFPDYEKALAKGREKSSADDGPGAPKQAKVDAMMSGSSRKVTQMGVNDRIFQMIVNSGLHFTLVRDESFRELIHYLQPTVKPLSYPALMAILTERFEEMKGSLKGIFAELDYVCATCDCWSVGSKSYFGMTAHYLDEDLNRKSVALACSRLSGSHTFDVLARVVEDKLREFCIQNKCVGVVTDNTSNFVKAFKDSAAGEASGEEGDFDEEDFDEEDDDSVTIKSAGDLLDERHDSEEIYHLPVHYRCAAHTLNLISTKDAESALGNAVYKKLYRSTLAKCQAVWNKQQSCTKTADEVRKKCGGLFLKIPLVTRWNSLYQALERFQRFFQESGDNLDSLMDILELERFREAEVQFVSEYLEVMKPFAQALNILQGEKNSYAGFLLPTTHFLKKKLRRREDKLRYCKPLVEALCSGIDTRFASQFRDKNYLLAAFLIPQFKNLNWLDAEETKTFIWEEIKKELSSLKKDDSSNRSGNDDSEDDFFPSLNNNVLTSSDLVSHYSSARFSTVEGLKDFPELKELFKKFNTVIPSSASVERLFSLGGGIFRKNRHGLKDESFEKQLLLKLNSGYY